jgi:hypothetical protein
MIVNELTFARRAVERTRIPRRPCGHDPSSSRSLDPCAGDPRLAAPRGTSRRGVRHSLRKAYCQEGINSGTPGLDARYKIISNGKIIAAAAEEDKNSRLFDPRHRQRVQDCPWTSGLPYR